MLNKIEIFENLTKIDIFRNFRNKIEIFLYILTKIEICRKFDQNRNFSKICPTSKFFEIFDKIETFRKFWPKSKFFENLTQIALFWNFRRSKFFKNFDQNRNFSKIWPKSIFFEIFEKWKICAKGWPKSKIFEKNFDFVQNFRKISILVKFSRNFVFN